MYKTVAESSSIPLWNRKFLNAYWIFVSVVTLGECINLLFVDDMTPTHFAIFYILRPSLLFLAILGVTEWIYRAKPSNPELLIISGSLLTGVTIWMHAGIDSIPILYFLPLIVSVFYFQKKYVYQASLINLLSFFLIYVFNSKFHSKTDPAELVSTILMISAGGYIFVKIMDRGVEILSNLKIDALTGLFNHITFHALFQKCLEEGISRNETVMLALMDVDNFKLINDTYGHRAGDIILRRAAQIIHSRIGQEDFAARYGGEEFAVLMPGREAGEAFTLCEKIRTSIMNTLHPELNGKSITISVGLCGLEPGMDKESCFQFADELLYQAKRKGKNRTETALELKIS